MSLAMAAIAQRNQIIRVVWPTCCKGNKMMKLEISPFFVHRGNINIAPLTSMIIAVKNSLSGRLGEAS